MKASAAIRQVSIVLCLALLTALDASARQQPVRADSAELGAAWQPAASSDATATGGMAVDVRFDVLRRAAAGGVLTLPLPDAPPVRVTVLWAQADAARLFVAGPLVG